MMKRSIALGVLFFVLFSSGLKADSLKAQMGKAKQLFQQSKFKDAALAYKSILTDFKDELKDNEETLLEVWQSFGDALQKSGHADLAQRAFERVGVYRKRIKKTEVQEPPPPDLPQETVSIEEPKLKSIKSEKAQKFYSRGVRFLQAKLLFYAIQEFERALEQENQNIDLMDILGRTMAEYGEQYYDRALELMKKVRASITDPKMEIDQWLGLARACTHAKKYDLKTAESALNAVLKADASCFLANYYMGDLLLVQGQYKGAIEWFNKAKSINSGDPRPFWGIGDSHTGLKEFINALDIYGDVYESNRQLGEAAYKFAVGLKNMKRIDDAIHFFEQAISLDPTKAKYHLGLVEIYLPRIMDFSAKKHLDAALALEPQNPWCHFYQGVFLEMRRRIDEAITEYQYAQYFGPEMLDVKYQLANIFSAVGNAFPGNNFSNDNPSDKLEYLPYKNVQQAYRLYKEILTINPKYTHSPYIKYQLTLLEDVFSIENELDEMIKPGRL